MIPRNGTPEHLAAVLYCAFADSVNWTDADGAMTSFVGLSDAAQSLWTVVARKAIECGANPDTTVGDRPAMRDFVRHEGDAFDLDDAAGGEAYEIGRLAE